MKIAFVIPTYNYARFLERCLLSVIQQDADDYEVVIVDDGSTDETSEVVSKVRNQNPNKEILYLYQENAGPSAARNKGAADTRCEYIWFLDADDRLVGGSIRRMFSAIDKNPDACLLFSGYRSVNEQGKKVNHEPTPIGENRTENFRCYILKQIDGLATGSTVVKKSVFESIRFPEGVHNNEDMVFFSHLFARYPVVSFPGILLETYRHKDSLRSNMTRIEETGIKAVDRLFDIDLLTPEQMSLRSMYLTRRYLSIFRSYYRNGNHEEGIRYYHKAIRESPRSLLEWAYMRKYLRCIWKKMMSIQLSK